MKRIPALPNRGMMSALIAASVTVVAIGLAPPPGVAGASGSGGALAPVAPTRVVPQDATTTTTTTSTSPATAQSIFAGPSRGECITPNVAGTSSVGYLQSLATSFNNLTGTTVTCLSAYLDNAQTWAPWEHPWVTVAANGYTGWVAQDPHVRELVLEVDMIPKSLANAQNPTKWEQACASGHYNGYATVLGRSLVAAGLQNSVIRLGAEMNGQWEADFIGTTVPEQKLWAKCFANEVTGLRRAKGENFLIDWNPNACADRYLYPNYYPGNAYVNIMGLDLYDVGCITPYQRLTFAQLASEQLGLNYFESFAAAKGKPMSLPEWGLAALPAGDDPGYISGIGKVFQTKDFAFETYFDRTGPSIGSLPLGPTTPLSVAAFRQWFGST